MATSASYESAARVYVQALQIGEPVSLPDASIEACRQMFETRKIKL